MLSDNALKPLDFLHIVFVFFGNCLLLGLLFYKEFGIIPLIRTHFFIFYFNGFISYAIKKISVVRDNDKRAGKRGKKALEPFNGFYIKMICRLVKQKQIAF